MTVTYPQCAVVLRIVWEDFGSKSPELQQTYTLELLPQTANVRLNNYKEADEFDISFDYRIFPFDPRVIRAIQVSIHIENMGSLVDNSGKPIRLKPRAPETGPDHNTVLMGFVDTEEIDLDEDTKTIKLSGRDFTSLYVDIKWTGKALSLAKPVDQVLKEMVSPLKTTGDIIIENRTGAALPILSKVYSDLGEMSGTRNANKNETYWDVIQDIANKAALIIFIELDKLVITSPRVLTNPKEAVNFFYGHNIKSLSFERKIGRMKGFNVRVRSIIGKDVKVIDIPRQAKNLDIKGKDIEVVRQNKKGAKVEDKEVEKAPFMSFSLSGITDENALIASGERIFEELSRQQIEGRFRTYEMQSFDNYRNIIDLTKIRNGAAVAIEVSPMDMKEMTRVSTKEERAAYLMSRNYPSAAAVALAENFGRFSTPFYVRDVEMEFAAEKGWSLQVTFINRIQVES